MCIDTDSPRHACDKPEAVAVPEDVAESESSEDVEPRRYHRVSGDLQFLYNHGSMQRIAQEVAASYNVEFCSISLADPDQHISKAACFSCDPATPWKAIELDDTQLFKMIVKRGVPTIVEDAHVHPFLMHDALVKQSALGKGVGCSIRFFVELPLRRNNFYFGTICLVDDKPRKLFNLDDAALLAKKANELIKAINDLGYFRRSMEP